MIDRHGRLRRSTKFQACSFKTERGVGIYHFSCQVKCYLLNLRIGHLFICRKSGAGTRGGERERVFLIFSFLVVSAYASLGLRQNAPPKPLKCFCNAPKKVLKCSHKCSQKTSKMLHEI